MELSGAGYPPPSLIILRLLQIKRFLLGTTTSKKELKKSLVLDYGKGNPLIPYDLGYFVTRYFSSLF